MGTPQNTWLFALAGTVSNYLPWAWILQRRPDGEANIANFFVGPKKVDLKTKCAASLQRPTPNRWGDLRPDNRLLGCNVARHNAGDSEIMCGNTVISRLDGYLLRHCTSTFDI